MTYDPYRGGGPPPVPPEFPGFGGMGEGRPVERPRRGGLVVPLLLLAILGVLVFRMVWDRGTPAVDPRPVTPAGDLAADEKATIELFKEVAPSVVFITTTGLQRDFWTRNVQEIPAGNGSGFIWDDAGHIVTNFHVIQQARGAFVTLNDHSDYRAELVGYSADNDIAVLRIRAPREKLRAVPRVGRSSDLKVGQKVFAVGNPFGLDQTLTTGIVSALGRTIQSPDGRPIEDVIQTDAAINPGNSGGPLFDSSRRLIGMNTAIYSPSGASAGIGFAVPVDTVNRVVPQIISRRRLPSIDTGIRIDDRISQAVRELYGIEGAAILTVRPGSAAAAAGLRGASRDEAGRIIPGDVIVKVGDRTIRTSQDFFAALQRRNPGEVVNITVLRDPLGERRVEDVPLKLEAEE